MNYRELLNTIQSQIAQQPSIAIQEAKVDNGGIVDGIGFNRSSEMLICQEVRFQHNQKSEWETFEFMFKSAGIPVEDHYELANQYWPHSMLKMRAENPWWLVKTPRGLITIGWRKRVISISWDFADVIVTDDEVTKESRLVHAWSDEDAVQYLKNLWGFVEAREICERDFIQPQELDDLVFDLSISRKDLCDLNDEPDEDRQVDIISNAENRASDINNQGLDAQIRFLVNALGVESLKAELAKIR